MNRFAFSGRENVNKSVLLSESEILLTFDRRVSGLCNTDNWIRNKNLLLSLT